jgi:hypothetical protein
MDALWITNSALIASYYLISTLLLISNFKKLKYFNPIKDTDQMSYSLIYIIPLLNEEKRFPSLMSQFSEILKKGEKSKLVLVTSEREYIYSKNENSTIALIKDYLKDSLLKDRIIHLHYPKINNVVAKQLNYAIEYFDSTKDNEYFIFYNADSILPENIYQILRNKLDGNIYQQSSLFTNNLNTLLNQKRFLSSAFAIYQSIWTMRTEITRLRLNNIPVRFLNKTIKLPVLTHCITHGLCIPKNEINSLKGFPDIKEGGEDVALGYLACLKGKKVNFLPTLENSDAPIHLNSYLKQMKFWFIALFFFFRYNYRGLKNQTTLGRYYALKLQAIFAIIRNFFSGFLILGYILLGILINKFIISFSIIILGQALLFMFFTVNYESLDLKVISKIK